MRMRVGFILVVVLAAIAAQAALFTQDFSSSTNAGDYVNAATPTANQFTLVNGGTASIDAGRLKIVNTAGVGGNVSRWAAMEGSPVGAMSFSYEMDLTFSETNKTRLITGTIGEPAVGRNWMAWGIDATGTDNEWNVNGSPTLKFTGAQTVKFFLNASGSAINYTDPAAGTQLLATNSYDIWVGTTLVADGRTDGYVHPEYDLTAFSLGLQSFPAVTYLFDNFEALDIPYNPDVVIYQDDFSGAAGAATTTVPEVSPTGFVQKYFQTGLDGNGRLESANPAQSSAGYRVKLGTDPLTANTAIADIKYTVTMRTPSNNWVMIGFQEADANGFLAAANNIGPVVQFNPTSVQLRGGTYGGGTTTTPLTGVYSKGDVITAEMTYHVADQTMDLAINGSTVTNGCALNHEFPVGTPSDPVVYWAQIQFFSQPSAANGGPYIDSFQIQTTTPAPVVVPGYAGWATGWGVDIGATTNDYDGDGFSNIYEYGLGGDPTNALVQGTPPVFGIGSVGGTNYFSYIYPQLSDTNSGLSYSLALRGDLVFGDWATNVGYVVTGTNVTGGTLDFVTNVTDTVDAKKFVRLIIE
ncbi:MAG: hypothetical protein K9M54_05440 [Kiritimatiellales bacterium]|nr:hypothetical protein [Kiritimatiellales bacterium]